MSYCKYNYCHYKCSDSDTFESDSDSDSDPYEEIFIPTAGRKGSIKRRKSSIDAKFVYKFNRLQPADGSASPLLHGSKKITLKLFLLKYGMRMGSRLG